MFEHLDNKLIRLKIKLKSVEQPVMTLFRHCLDITELLTLNIEKISTKLFFRLMSNSKFTV